jgi:adenylate cyclase
MSFVEHNPEMINKLSQMNTFLVLIYRDQKLVHQQEWNGVLEIGRQDPDLNEPLPFAVSARGGQKRLIIAAKDDTKVSRNQLRLEMLSDGRVRVNNLGRYPFAQLAPQESRVDSMPFVLPFGAQAIRIEAMPLPPQLVRLDSVCFPPGNVAKSSTLLLGSGPVEVEQLDCQKLIEWFRSTINVLRGAAGSDEFFRSAAEAIVNLVGLDAGHVLLRESDDWKTQATALRQPVLGDSPPSRTVLAQVYREKTTFRELPEASTAASLMNVRAVVAAPILDVLSNVVGLLYGDRRGDSASPTITSLEALLVETLAMAVAAGLARIEQERKAMVARVRFEQFFTPALARELAADSRLLEPREAEVTVLFADLRGFSSISEKLSPKTTMEWITDVLQELSVCVLQHDGVVLDYLGDEIVAMWGAPRPQHDQADLACRAAIEMLRKLPDLNERWKGRLGATVDLGIGINTGKAQVGNKGSKAKFSYGPLGDTVNLASRVQGATKYLKTSLLLTEATRQKLVTPLPLRRLCRVEVMHKAVAVELYELVPAEQFTEDLRERYEQALAEFENGGFRPAARTLGQLYAQYSDGPSLVLLQRAVNGMVDGSSASAVWKLPGK